MMRTFIRTLFVALVLLGMPNESYSQSLLKQLGQAAKDFKEGVQEGLGITSKSKNSSKTDSKKKKKSSSDDSSTGTQQSSDLVTLVVTGDGATKDEAIKVALRSAIEQAYGAFVSANTEILNDELVKDEIVSVASGNIHGYKELGAVMLPNGNQSVTLQATVSTSKLVAYAQNKGAETEFAGATFGANLRLYEMNKKAEEKALENLYSQLEMLAPFIYDYEIEVSDPVLVDGQPDLTWLAMAVKYKANDNTKAFGELIHNTINGLAINADLASSMTNQGFKLCVYLTESMLPNQEQERDVSDEGYSIHYVNLNQSLLERIFTLALFNFCIKDNLGGIYKISDCRSALRHLYQNYGYGNAIQWESIWDGRSKYIKNFRQYSSAVFRRISSVINVDDHPLYLPVSTVLLTDYNYKAGEEIGFSVYKLKVPTEAINKISKITIERGDGKRLINNYYSNKMRSEELRMTYVNGNGDSENLSYEEWNK